MKVTKDVWDKFQVLDTDGNGRIDYRELLKLSNALGGAAKNHSSTVSASETPIRVSECCSMPRMMVVRFTNRELKQAFDEMDMVSTAPNANI